jgi:peptidoglycan/xylan/chitin deacetylase (PgdA/CDA1 family)
MTKKITRRSALTSLGLGSAYLMTGAWRSGSAAKRHIITLSYDDGFEKSSIRTAEIYEKYGLSAAINVIASAHQKQFELPNEYHAWPVGDFGLWNDLQARGHEIMPHGYNHSNLKELPLKDAQELVNNCLDIFSSELDGFQEKHAVFNFPYNASSPALEDWLQTRVRAIRTGGPVVNPLPHEGQYRLTCISHGPENIDRHLEEQINEFLEGPSGWFIYNTHGLDEEGWGPLSSAFLDELLHRLSKHESAEVLSVTQSLDQINKQQP